MAADLNDVVLVGGCSHMPGVKRALLSVFHTDPIAPDPEAAAARGAAMQAQLHLQNPVCCMLGMFKRCLLCLCCKLDSDCTPAAGGWQQSLGYQC